MLRVKGGNKPSGEEIRVLFPRIQEYGGSWDLNSNFFIRTDDEKLGVKGKG